MTLGIKYHDKLAPDWDKRYQHGSFLKRYNFIRSIFETEDLSGKWLDAGCGTGNFSTLLARMGASSVIAVDGSSSMISRAIEINAPQKLPISFLQIQSIERLPFESNSFDGIISFSVLEYVEDVDSAMAEFARVLRCNAPLILSVPQRGSALRKLQKIMRHLRIVQSLEYIDTSNFELAANEGPDWLGRSGFLLDRTKTFDPIFSKRLHSVFPASMLFLKALRA
jgi:ubiquinone/menaquinone biosynthesis C-methylase UbiE